MKNKFSWLLLLWIPALMILVATSCKEDTSNCFDEQLYEQHKNDICTQDCPGVETCSGYYCNECIANSNGYQVIQ